MIQNVGPVQAEFCSLDLLVIGECVLDHGRRRVVRTGSCIVFDHRWRQESVLRLRHGESLRRPHRRSELSLANALHVAVGAWTWQFIL